MTKIKPPIERYLKLTFWAACNFDNQVVSEDDYRHVLEEIGRMEDELLASGLTSQQVEWLVKYVTNIADKPLIELPENQQTMMIEAIFGKVTPTEKAGRNAR